MATGFADSREKLPGAQTINRTKVIKKEWYGKTLAVIDQCRNAALANVIVRVILSDKEEKNYFEIAAFLNSEFKSGKFKWFRSI